MIARFVLALEALLEPAASALKHSAIAYLVAVIVGSLTVIQFTIDFWARKEERAERRATAVERAWQSLLTPLGGDTGKGASLNFLFDARAISENVQLSCKNMGIWDTEDDLCVAQPYLSGVVFPPIIGNLPVERYVNSQLIDMAKLSYPRVDDVQILDSDMRGAIVGSEFGDLTVFKRVGFENAMILGPLTHFPLTERIGYGLGNEFGGPLIERSDLSNAFVAEDAVYWVRTSNLSGITLFVGLQTYFENGHQWHQRPKPLTSVGNWAWADNPPKRFLSGDNGPTLLWLDGDWLDASGIALCDPRHRMREDSSRAYREMNERYTPNFGLVRQFEFVPLGDGTVEQQQTERVIYFQPVVINTSERYPFCYRMTVEEAAELWPEVYKNTDGRERIIDLAQRVMGRANIKEEIDRLDRLDRMERQTHQFAPP